jgi:hypothetical protein
MYTFPLNGDAHIYLQYNGDVLDTATGIDAAVITPPTQYFCYYQQGGETGLVDGVKLTGQTSGAVIKVKKVVLTGGTIAADSATGVLFYEKISGTISSGENLRVSSTTYAISASGELDAPQTPASAIFLSVETNTIRYAAGGFTPTNATGTPASYGTPIVANGSITIIGTKDVHDFKMINAAAGSNAVVNVHVMY